MSTIYWGLPVSVSNTELGTPLVLLARPGAARERLREAVIAAGGRVVLEEDPSVLEPEQLQAITASVVLVALEPAIEEAIERLEHVLESPQLSLIFDEAELAAQREGWEAQRWIRHLAAKLHGHDDVLPPGHESDRGAALAAQVPVIPAELPGEAASSASAQTPEEAVSAPDDDWGHSVDLEPAGAVVHEFQPVEFQYAARGDAALLEVPVRMVEPPSLPPVVQDFSSWALVEDDAIPTPVPRNDVTPEISSFLTRDLSLVDIDPGTGVTTGAVLLLAGIGGPDALRRFLGALPETFVRPVLVQMRLDGGRYGNLVKQIARVTPMPVLLAEPGTPLEASNIYVLPDNVGISVEDSALRFVADVAIPVIERLPPADSAVVMLSGADQELVDAAIVLAAQGGWVAGQVSDGCYDPAAAIRLAAHGMSTGDPVYLANALTERWGA